MLVMVTMSRDFEPEYLADWREIDLCHLTQLNDMFFQQSWLAVYTSP
jgi:hypothetical protein